MNIYNSPFSLFDEELLPILRAAKRRGLRVLWIAVSAFLHEESRLNSFQALNDPNRPINQKEYPESMPGGWAQFRKALNASLDSLQILEELQFRAARTLVKWCDRDISLDRRCP